MKVADFMKRQVVTVAPTIKLSRLWAFITNKHLHGLPVVDKDKKLLGFVAKEDFLTKLYPDYVEDEDLPTETDSDVEIAAKLEKLKKLTAKDIMKTQPVFTRPDTNVMRALSRMIIRKVRQLPVLDETDQVVGLVSKADIFAGLFKKKHQKLPPSKLR